MMLALFFLVAVSATAFGQGTTPAIDPNTFYYIVNQATGTVMDATGCMGDGCKVVANSKQPLRGQLWQIKPKLNSPYFAIANLATGSCLNDPGSSWTAGTQLILWGGCDPTSAADNSLFKFSWHSESADQGWQITIKSNSMSLDLPITTPANGTQLQFHQDNGNIAVSLIQRWSLVSLC